MNQTTLGPTDVTFSPGGDATFNRSDATAFLYEMNQITISPTDVTFSPGGDATFNRSDAAAFLYEMNQTTLSPSSDVTFSPGGDSTLSPSDAAAFLYAENRAYVSRLAPTLVYMVALGVAGFVGNVVVFAVYYLRFKPSATRTFILTMSVCDWLSSCLVLTADMLKVHFHYSYYVRGACQLSRFLRTFLAFFSALVLVFVALDRRHTVCKARGGGGGGRLYLRKIRLCLAVGCAVSMAVALPSAIIAGDRTATFPDQPGVTGNICAIDDAYRKSTFLKVYKTLLGVAFVASITTMIGSYFQIARCLWKHQKHMSESGRSGSVVRKVAEETSISASLCAVSSQGTSDKTLSHSQEHSGQSGTNSKVRTVSEETSTTRVRAVSSQQGSSDMTLSQSQGQSALDAIETLASDSNAVSEAVTSESDPTSPDSAAVIVQPQITQPQDKGCVALQAPLESNSATKSGIRGRRQPTTTARAIPTRVTVMMFLLTAVFVVSFLPFLLVVSLEAGGQAVQAVTGVNGHHVAIRSYYVNFAANSLVYCFVNAAFRREASALFLKGWHRLRGLPRRPGGIC